jgi:hypothetical protein
MVEKKHVSVYWPGCMLSGKQIRHAVQVELPDALNKLDAIYKVFENHVGRLVKHLSPLERKVLKEVEEIVHMG